jgi:hypothetical protein
MTSTNVVKTGSTVPLRFQLLRNGTILSDPAAVTGITTTPCTIAGPSGASIGAPGAAAATVQLLAGTQQFVVPWRVPSEPGCYRVAVTLDGGTGISATFQATR